MQTSRWDAPKIIGAAGISGSSYDRYINELAAWDIIEPTESRVDGGGKGT